MKVVYFYISIEVKINKKKQIQVWKKIRALKNLEKRKKVEEYEVRKIKERGYRG